MHGQVESGKHVRITKKIRVAGGVWRFISLDRIGSRYVWDKRPGTYFLEWWEGKRRKREKAGLTPSEALEAKRRKRLELLGELAAGGKLQTPLEDQNTQATRISDAIGLFASHVKAHSPAKPRTLERYREALKHFERVLGGKNYVEAITRTDIDDYKIARSTETFGERERPVSPATVNFEGTVLRTFFYYLIRERGLKMENPCARFKPLRAERERLKRKPSVYTQDELSKLWKACDTREKAIFASLLLSGLRKQELTSLTWEDVDLKKGSLRIRAKGDFIPKDYEEREIPIPPDLVVILKRYKKESGESLWVFASREGNRLGRNEMLRLLKAAATRAGLQNATLHKFRHTYATRLLEGGCDIVTVQHLLGHSDLETTRKYLSPDDALKRKAIRKLTLN